MEGAIPETLESASAHWILTERWWIYWLPTAAFILHIAEEYPRFCDWATRHFGTTSRAWYVYSHIPLFGICALASFMATSASPGSPWLVLVATIAVVQVSNAVFHVVTTLLFREYSPGLVTACLAFLPAAWIVLQHAVGALAPAQVQLATGLGALLGLLIVASLWLDMDVGWNLRKR